MLAARLLGKRGTASAVDALIAQLEVFEDTDAALQAKLAEIDPENCTMYGGGANTIR